jgi:hypothetical protein
MKRDLFLLLVELEIIYYWIMNTCFVAFRLLDWNMKKMSSMSKDCFDNHWMKIVGLFIIRFYIISFEKKLQSWLENNFLPWCN